MFDFFFFCCMDIAKAVIFHISAVNFTWTRGDKAPVTAGHDYCLFDPAVIATVHVITDGKKNLSETEKKSSFFDSDLS